MPTRARGVCRLHPEGGRRQLRSRTPICLPREAGATLTLVNIFRGKKQKTGMKSEIQVLELVPKAPAAQTPSQAPFQLKHQV